MVLPARRVLVADDDERTRRLVSMMLSTDGMEVIGAADGSEALRLAREQKPDVILMDVLMPGMDGYSALDEIKKDVVISGIPVLMLSGIDLDMNKKLAEKLGSCGYLTKPFTRQSLLEALASCAVEGNGHNGHNEVL